MLAGTLTKVLLALGRYEIYLSNVAKMVLIQATGFKDSESKMAYMHILTLVYLKKKMQLNHDF